MGENEMSGMELKTVVEMIIMILEDSKGKEDALEKLKKLSIIRN